MPTEEELQQQEQAAGSEAVVDSDDEAAFAAGFAEARGEEPPAVEAKTEEQPNTDAADEGKGEENTEAKAESQAEPETKTEEQQEQKTDQEEQQVPKLTDAELNKILARLPALEAQNQKAFGKIGELQRTINELKSGSGSGGKATSRLTAEQLTRLNKDYPELAQALAEDLSEIGTSSAAGPDPEAIEQIVEKRVTAEREKLTQELETKLLTRDHRDWPQIVASEEFAVWKQTLPDEVQAQLDTSWDAAWLSEKFTEYKNWRSTRTTETQKRQERLKQAVVPEGKPEVTTAINDDEAFAAGFNAVRKGG